MKHQKLLPLLALLFTLPASAQGADPKTRAELQEDFLNWKFGMFIHFNMATYIDKSWAQGDEDPSLFKPDQLDCDQWAKAAVSAGMKYAVLTVKHTGGWCLWDSEQTASHDMTAFTNYRNGKGDIVREFVEACRKHDLKVGLYYCLPRDFRRTEEDKQKESLRGLPPEAKGRQVEFIKTQMTELLTRYGQIDQLWFDQYQFDVAEQWTEIFAHVKSIQPNCIIIANNSINLKKTDIHSYEYPWLKNKKDWLRENNRTALPPEDNAVAAEVCDMLEPGWFWNSEKDWLPKKASQVVDMVRLCNTRNANYLLNVAPNRSGVIPAASVARLKEIGELLRHPEKADQTESADKTGAVISTPVLTEKILGNGDSEITVANGGKTIVTYKINLSTHHHPALTENDSLMERWSMFKYGAFLCYNSNQFSGKEFCTIKHPREYNPEKLDVGQWIRTIKSAGMDHAVLTARHTSPFLLWDSATSEFDVANSGDTTDVVAGYVRECREQGIKPGLYYCLWGGKKCSVTGNEELPEARATILAQLHELATNYGKIPYFWIDMMNWAPANLSTQEIYDTLKNINPDCIVMFNQHIRDGSVIRYFPTDAINGEMHLPPTSGHNPVRIMDGTSYYIPFEYEPCSQRRESHKINKWDFPEVSWFTYGEGKNFEPSEPFSPEFLYDWIKKARDRGASNVLLSCAPDHTGQFRKQDIEQLKKLGELLNQ